MFRLNKGINTDSKVKVENNEMYIKNITARLSTTLSHEAKEAHHQLMTAVQNKRKTDTLHRDIKHIYTEGHTANKYGDRYIDPVTLKTQSESVNKTEKEMNAAAEKVADIENDIAELVKENELNESERAAIEDIETDLNERDKVLSLKIETFFKEIQNEYKDVEQKKKDIHRVKQLNEGLKSFSAHNYVEPSVRQSTVTLLSRAALNKLKTL